MNIKDRRELGRLVREVWVSWAQEQPDINQHPNWLTPWEELSAREQEVDMRIAECIYACVLEKLVDTMGIVQSSTCRNCLAEIEYYV